MDKAREAALMVLKEVNHDGKYANISVKTHLKDLSRKDTLFATRLVYGTLENQTVLDRILAKYINFKRTNPWVLNILRMGSYQILYLDRVPDSAACNESVKLCNRHGLGRLKGFVNGVLRNISRNKSDFDIAPEESGDLTSLADAYGYPEWVVNLWTSEYGVDTARQIISYSEAHNWITVRANSIRISSEELRTKFMKQGIEVEKGRYFRNALRVKSLGNIQENPFYRDGLFSVQGESSMLVSKILDPSPGERVLDACSAPGGKAVYMAELMGLKGKVIAWDKHRHRVDLIDKNKERLGAKIVEPSVQDATEFKEDMASKMDRVLVDAPCSGWGVIHKKPDIKLRIDEDRMPSLYNLQWRIISNCRRYVKKSGILVYSTCTMNPMENERLIKKFIGEYPEFALEDFTHILPKGLRNTSWNKGMIQLFPWIHGVDGFFIAKLRRIA